MQRTIAEVEVENWILNVLACMGRGGGEFSSPWPDARSGVLQPVWGEAGHDIDGHNVQDA